MKYPRLAVLLLAPLDLAISWAFLIPLAISAAQSYLGNKAKQDAKGGNKPVVLPPTPGERSGQKVLGSYANWMLDQSTGRPADVQPTSASLSNGTGYYGSAGVGDALMQGSPTAASQMALQPQMNAYDKDTKGTNAFLGLEARKNALQYKMANWKSLKADAALAGAKQLQALQLQQQEVGQANQMKAQALKNLGYSLAGAFGQKGEKAEAAPTPHTELPQSDWKQAPQAQQPFQQTPLNYSPRQDMVPSYDANGNVVWTLAPQQSNTMSWYGGR